MKKLLAVVLSIAVVIGMIPAMAFAGTESSTKFTDVKSSDYFYDAVLWALENGITQGTTDTTFSPNNECSRGQIVTFLYRDAGEPALSTADSTRSNTDGTDTAKENDKENPATSTVNVTYKLKYEKGSDLVGVLRGLNDIDPSCEEDETFVTYTLTVPYGIDETVSFPEVETTSDTCEFDGWYDQDNKLDVSENISAAKDVEYTARLKVKEIENPAPSTATVTYTLSYDKTSKLGGTFKEFNSAEDGTFEASLTEPVKTGNEVTAVYTVTYKEESGKLTQLPEVTPFETCTFDGWVDENGDVITGETEVRKGAQYTAKFTSPATVTYTLSFEKNLKKAGDIKAFVPEEDDNFTTHQEDLKADGNTITATCTVVYPKEEGTLKKLPEVQAFDTCTFDGWYEGNTKISADTPVKDGAEYTAKFIPNSIKNPFTDVKISWSKQSGKWANTYYYNAVLWAINNNITNGTSGTTFSPDLTCTRGQVVTFLYRTYGDTKKDYSSMPNPFTDVPSPEYYHDAVLWAVANGITQGTSDTTFSPNAPCTRAQVVTFLWRYHNKKPENTLAVNSIVTFGSYEQDNNTNNGKKEIKWRVLDNKNGKVLLLSEYGLDCKKYNDTLDTKKSYDWENCTLRGWLNKDFLNTAFSENEKTWISLTEVKNPDAYTGYAQDKRYVRNNTGIGITDLRYKISGGNATKDNVFLLSIDEAKNYLKYDEGDPGKDLYPGMQLSVTDYAKSHGAYTTTEGGKVVGWWWLRSPGYDNTKASYVTSNGGVYGKNSVNQDYGSVRPALWVDLSMPEREEYNRVSSSVQVKDVVTFGSYEQDNNPESNNEPIEWIVLKKEGGKALLLSKYGLDCQPYNNENKVVTWETCTLQNWLNSTFLNTAFNSSQKSQISDQVFLLSVDEAKLLGYEKADSQNIYPNMQASATAYAKARGAYASSSYTTADGKACTWWWLRSPGPSDDHASTVGRNGVVDDGSVDADHGAVRPAIWVNLAS